MAENYDDDIARFKEVLSGLSRDLANFGTNISETTGKESAAASALSNFDSETRKAQKALEDFDKKLETAAAGAYKGLQQFGSGLVNGLGSADKGLSKYSSGITAFGDGLGNLAEVSIPGFGKAINLGIKAVTMATDAVLKQNDAIMKSYDDLGKFGAGLGMSTDEVLQLANKAGYGSKNLEGLFKSAKELDGTLGALGGSSSAGIKAFTEIASVSDNMRGSFRALGYSQEEVTEMQAQYIKQLGMTGGIQNKTTKQLSEESQNYILQLNALAEITGKSVKEQQKGQELALQQANFNAYVYSLQQKREKATDENEKKRLDKQIKDYTEFGGLIKNSGLDAETQIAALSSVTAKGSVVIGEHNAKLAANGVNLEGMKDALQSGKGSLSAYNGFMGDMNKAVKRNSDALGDNAFALGKTSESMGGFFLLNNANREATTKWQQTLDKANGATQRNVDLTKMDSEQLAEFQLQLAKSTKEDDKRLVLQIESEKVSREYKVATDALVNLLSKAVNPIMTIFFKGLSFGVNIIKSFVQIINSVTDTFEDFGDLIDDIKFGIRSSTILQKVFGLTPPTEAEVKVRQEKKNIKQAERDFRDEALWGKDYKEIRAASKAGNLLGPLGGAIAASAAQSQAEGRRERKETEALTGQKQSAPSTQPATQPAGSQVTTTQGGAAIVSPSMGRKQPSPTQPQISSEPQSSGEQGKPSTGTTTPVTSQSTTAKDIKQVLETGPGFNKVETVDGDIQVRQGVRNWRNNNPGNIIKGTFAQKYGSVGGDDRFAIFPSLEAGKKAKEDLLFGASSKYIDLSIANAISRYAPPNENNTNAYINSVTKALGGISPDTVLKSLDSSQRSTFLDAISKVEGFKEGKVFKARNGGEFDGPESGYLVELHGKEIVAPTEKLKQLLANMNQVTKSELGESVKNTKPTPEPTPATTPISDDKSSMILGELYTLMEDKLRDLIDAVNNGNNTQSKILQYSRV